MRAHLARCPDGAVLMDTSVHPELVALTGIPLRQTINESDRSLYREALAAPAQHAALVLAFDGDAIDQAVKAHPDGLRAVAHFAAKHQPPATLYVSESLQPSRCASTTRRHGDSIGQGRYLRNSRREAWLFFAIRNPEDD